MLTFNLNWLAVIVSAIVSMAVGAVWYGPLFGKRWMKEVGFTQEDIESGQTWPLYLIAMLNSLCMTFVLANAIAWAGVTGIGGGLLLGALMWIGFTGLTFAVNHAFEGRTIVHWAINSGMYLTSLMIAGVILAVWR
jgi:hypothetical protein